MHEFNLSVNWRSIYQWIYWSG